MVTFKERSFIAKFPGILVLTIVSTIWISSQVSTVHGMPATTTPLVVKITSPHKGQQVGIGHNVTLLGTSSHNASSKCQVSIIVDKKRPYQNTIPMGQGAGNYSEWKYTLAPTYTALTEGMNRVTAKLTCNSNPVFTKFYSINLTGINQPTTSQPQQQIAIRSNGTTSPFFLPTSFSLASAVSNSTLASSNSTSPPSVLPVSVNSSSLIDPSATLSSSSSSSGHSHVHNHSHHTHHSSSSSGEDHSSSSSGEDHSSSSSGEDHSSSSSGEDHSSSSSSSHIHSGSENHNNGNGGHSSDSHHRSGHDFFHGAFSHFGG